MALRLTDSPGSSPPPAHGGLDVHAIAALRAQDVDGYGCLFAEAARIEDESRRYIERCRLIEAALEVIGELGPACVVAVFITIVHATVDILESEPREPVLLNYAGVAFYELGELGPAESLFRAVLRLDPEMPHIAGNLDEIGRRRRANLRFAALPATMAVALKALGKRAEAVARRAQPAAGRTLSLCMIVRDEEEMLPRCLEAAAPAVDEIVVVDTGSTDRTAEIARSFGAKVIEFPWTGSFADARNVSFEAASGDWVLYLDADEVLVPADAPKLRELTGRIWREAFFLAETNYTGHEDHGTGTTHNALRMFRNRPHYRFEGRLHEQIAQHLPRRAERIEVTPIRIEHYGYLGAVRDAKDKSRRNIELLEQQAAEGHESPFQAYNLGSEYAAIGENAKALRHFRNAWTTLRSAPDVSSRGFAPSLVSRYVTVLRGTGNLEEADRQAAEGLEFFPGFTDLVFEQALTATARGDFESAIALLERCLEMGEAPPLYTSTLGCGTFLALAALGDAHRAAGDVRGAIDALSRCLREYPRFLGAVLPLAEAMLGRGDSPDSVAAEIEDCLPEATPSARFMLGTALYERGFTVQAEPQFRLVAERQPGNPVARIALAEALLSQSRYDEAAEEAARVCEADPASSAWQTEVFARIVGGDAGGARAALERCRAAGADAGALGVFSAWLDGAEGAGALPAASAPLLETVLEALLRVEEFEAFEALEPAVERLQIPWRERRELLAAVYLRRGFLESAADEWIAAGEREGPDVRVLAGLAQVAAARGLADEATVLAEEAAALAQRTN